MRWRWFVFAMALLGAAGCTNPAAPRYPQPDDEPTEREDPEKGGFLLTADVTFWA